MENITGYLPLILMFVVVYFFFIRPQQKKAKDQSNFEKNLKKGDQVATNSGIIGKISKIEDDRVTLLVDQKTYITFLRATINAEMTHALNKEEKQ
jgi:preprotein translocase subunit YajC